MPQMEVNIGKLKLKNPVCTASGTCGYGKEMANFYGIDRLGAIFVKGISLEPWTGNPVPRTVETPAGMINAIGLQNDGVENFLAEKLVFLRDSGATCIVNVVGHSVDEYVRVAEKVGKAEGVHAIELNVSCPNVKEGCLAFGSTPEGVNQVVSAVRNTTDTTIITKLSPNVTDIKTVAKAAENAGADAISLVNTFLATAIDIESQSFRLANRTGGLSGPCIKPIALRMVWEAASVVNIPIVGQGGILTGGDAVEFLLAGASAVCVGTGNFVDPLAPVKIIDFIEDYLQKKQCSSVTDIIGKVS